ncbi:MAG: FimB/Mfa2 family fimbrial subunit [Prevotella sp.]
MNGLGKFLVLAFLTLSSLNSCERIDGLDEVNGDTETPASSVTRSVQLVAKTADMTHVCYPILVYAFDKDGVFVGSATITDSNDSSARLSLRKGQYHITAVSLPDCYSMPANITDTKAKLTMPESGYATIPLMTGSADITVSSSDQTAHVMLGYRQAGISLTVSGVPSDVSEVKVTLSSVYTDMTLDGDMSGQTATTIACTKSTAEDNTSIWTTDKFYVYPSTNAHPAITISMEGTSTGAVSYSHTYNASLLSGTPYTFTALYSGGSGTGTTDEEMTVNAEITAGEWAEEIYESFTFGNPDNSHEELQPEVVYVSSVPSAGAIWNGHVIATVDQDEDYTNEYNVMLLSLQGWTGVASAYNETSPTEALAIAEEYEEAELSGWRIPSRSDGVLLYNAYSDINSNLSLSANIISCGGSGIILDNGSSAARYLCEDGTYTYSFRNAVISVAGAKTKYHLRLVKYMKFILNYME